MSATRHIYRCPVCSVAYSMSSKDPDLRLLAKGIKCPSHPCTGKLSPFAKTNAKIKAVKVTAAELYQAQHVGFKSERYNKADLLKLLKGAVIEGVDITDSGSGRPLINYITLENGKTVHLGPSILGVVATRVTEKNDVG